MKDDVIIYESIITSNYRKTGVKGCECDSLNGLL